MAVALVFSVMDSVLSLCLKIKDRLDQMKLSENVAERIKDKAEYIRSTIQLIEPCLSKNSDIKRLEDIHTHFNEAFKLCSDISKKHSVIKFAKTTKFKNELYNLYEKMNMASDKLILFMTTISMAKIWELSSQLEKSVPFMKGNRMAGVTEIIDKSIRRPPAPAGLDITHYNDDKFILSWNHSGGSVSHYEVCIDENSEEIVAVSGKCISIILESPIVHPGNVYAMKVRGVNKGGHGAWSNVVIGKLTKPFPQKPEITNLFLESTTAVVTVKIPGAVRITESPVTCVKISYIMEKYKTLSNCEFNTNSTAGFYEFTISELSADSIYSFRAKSKNAEGWSKPSAFREGKTLPLPTPLPKNVRMSSNRTHSLLKIRWNAPDSPAELTHYEIVRKTKNSKYSDTEPVKAPANKLSVTFTKLKHNTYYKFKICTCNGIHVSPWSEEIETNTRIHKGIKALLSPAVWALGTVTSPILTPIGVGVAAGVVANEETSNKAAVAAAGTAGTVGGAALGIVGAPFIGAAFAHAFVHGTDELSDQSDDDDAVIIEC